MKEAEITVDDSRIHLRMSYKISVRLNIRDGS